MRYEMKIFTKCHKRDIWPGGVGGGDRKQNERQNWIICVASRLHIWDPERQHDVDSRLK